MPDVQSRIEELAIRKIFLISDITGGQIPADPVAEELIFSRFLDEYDREVLISLKEALRVFQFSKNANDALIHARIRFQGTDGIRGKVDPSRCQNYLQRFVTEQVITPDLIENNCYSFAEILQQRRVLSCGDAVLVGEDGRDLFGGKFLSAAMKNGFSRAGLVVYDLGLAPTPEVPFQMLTCGVRAGAVLTASHNPANQNGLKFFLDGRKLLPEGDVGDYTLSAYQYKNTLEPLPSEYHQDFRTVCPDKRQRFVDCIVKSLPRAKDKLPDIRIVCDPANGALSMIAPTVLERLGADSRVINAEPTGDNINQGGGVAELEEIDRIEGRVDQHTFADYLFSVRTMFEEGRSSSKPVFGIVFDGDGDRGYLLAYDKNQDALQVVDGDRAGFIIARHLAQADAEASEKFFLSTVESDLMTSYYVRERLGCQTHICPVGDKWLSAFDKGPVLLAEESSGHIIIPTPISSPDGKQVTLMAGNGLQATLFLLCCILNEKLTTVDLAAPFPTGVRKTAYVYNVDRSLLTNGTEVWKADMDALRKRSAELMANGELPAGYELRFTEKPEDSDMLFATLLDSEGRIVGTVFARNSGTEVKTATYCRGKPDLEASLVELVACVNRNHITMMKDVSSHEFQMEQAIMDAVQQRGSLPESHLASVIKKAIGSEPSNSTVKSVLYGLRKEGRIRIENETLIPAK